MKEANLYGQVWLESLEEATDFFKSKGAIEVRHASHAEPKTYYFFNTSGREVGHFFPMFSDHEHIASGFLFGAPRIWHPSILASLDVTACI